MNEQIKNDLVTAMKNQDKFTTSVLRMLKSAIQSEAINKKHDLTDDEVIAVIKKQVKVRNSSLEEYKNYNRTDMVEDLTKEIEILSKYLPEELSLEELDKIITETIKEVNATSIKEMGLVIKSVSAKVGNRADMSIVSKKVKEILSN